MMDFVTLCHTQFVGHRDGRFQPMPHALSTSLLFQWWRRLRRFPQKLMDTFVRDCRVSQNSSRLRSSELRRQWEQWVEKVVMRSQ